MGKDHGGFLTPKAIANRIKAKGLQKLRWYCQMCQKQCRDENGFKCHCASESHQRQMALFSSRARTFLDTFSQQFKDDFLNQLRHRHGTSRVHANLVYNDFIRDRHHVHMNATQWTSLTEFVKYLGKEGICQVEDTPKGWYLTYIDRDPKVIARQEALERRKQSELDDADRERRRIAKQIAKAREAEGGEQGGGEGAEDGGEEENGMGMELPEGKIAFTLAPSTSTTSTGSSVVNGDEKEERKKEDEEQEGKKRKREKNKDEEGADVKKERRDDEERDKHTKRRRSSDREDERDSRSSHSRSRSPSRERSSRWDRRNKHDPSSSSSSSSSSSTSKDTQRRPLTALEEIKQREERKKQLQQRQLELKQQKQKEQQEQKKQQQQTTPDYWLVPGLIVKVKHKTLEGGRYYNKKGAVLSVEAKYLATIEMLDGGDVLKLDQNFLETVIPAVGGRVKVVNGKHRGKTAVLQAIDVDRFCATIALLPDREEDREEKVVVEGVEYEHICKVK